MSIHLDSPYFQDGQSLWLKGNLHVHSQRSDGAETPQRMVDEYSKAGYDFLGLSDHDVLGVTDGLESGNMILLQGTEVCGGCNHMIDVGARTLVKANTDLQKTIDAINATSGFAILCHPNWEQDFNHYPYETLLALKNYAGIEIFNGVVIDLAGYHLATDKWDRLLTEGRRVWGYAHDDAHRLVHTFRGWNMVQARQRTGEAILDSLKNGRCYASSGVEITSIATDGPVLTVKTANAQRIAVFGQYGARLICVEAAEVVFDTTKVASPYVRVECYGGGDRTAWTQPFYIRNGIHETIRENMKRMGKLEKSSLQVLRSATAPALTGRMDDPLWAKAPIHGNFMMLKDGATPPVATQVRAILCDKTLYLAAKCAEPQMDKMRVKITADGEPNIWANDSMEFFLDVEGKGTNYFHIMVSSNGFHAADARGPQRPACPAVASRASKWEDDSGQGWMIEAAIDLSKLEVNTAPGTRWGFHVSRSRFPVAGNFVWSWVGMSNHSPSQFGELRI